MGEYRYRWNPEKSVEALVNVFRKATQHVRPGLIPALRKVAYQQPPMVTPQPTQNVSTGEGKGTSSHVAYPTQPVYYPASYRAETPILDTVREIVSRRAVATTVSEVLRSRFSRQTAEEKQETLTCWRCGEHVPTDLSTVHTVEHSLNAGP